jgi:hypothetical protein
MPDRHFITGANTMNNQKLTILGVVAAAMLVWAIFQAQWANRKPPQPDVPKYLIQGLAQDKIAAIELTAEKDKVRLTRGEKGFVVATKDNYPAKTSEINAILAACLDLKPAELRTENSANHADLGVTAETARYAVSLLDADGKPLAGFFMSKSSEQTNEVYVRPMDGNKVYRVAENNWPYISPIDFVEKELTNPNRDDIVKITVTVPDGSYVLDKPDQGNIVLEKLPEGKQFKGSEYKSVFEAIAGLSLEDVQKESDKTADLKFDSSYVAQLKDSTVYTLAIAKKDEKYYVKCDAAFMDTTKVEIDRSAKDSEEELKKKEAKLLAHDKAVAFSQKHKGWIYTIPSYKAQSMTKKLADLLEDIKKPEAPATPATPTAPVAPTMPTAPQPAAPVAPAQPAPEAPKVEAQPQAPAVAPAPAEAKPAEAQPAPVAPAQPAPAQPTPAEKPAETPKPAEPVK